MTNTVCEQLNNYNIFWVKIGLIGGIWVVAFSAIAFVRHVIFFVMDVVDEVRDRLNKGEK